jgi:hypothetical protein
MFAILLTPIFVNLLEPARKYFLDGPGKKCLEDMKEIKVSR